MENEEIIVLEEFEESPDGPEVLCCSLTYLPLRG